MTVEDAEMLATLAGQTFIESHGKSAPMQDIEAYITEKYSVEMLRAAIENHSNIYHLLYYQQKLAGYSNIIFNVGYNEEAISGYTKLDRLYLLEAFFHLHLGTYLFNYNLDLIKAAGQQGVWLYVWEGNKRAVNFYLKKGFVIIGKYDFPVSANHSNPNFKMLLEW